MGANRGDWTRLALSIFPNAAAIMIEPQDEMATYLTKLSATLANCHYVKAGAGSETGELVQTIWPDLNGSSFLFPFENDPLRNGKQRKTQIVTIDSLLQNTYPDFVPDLVKLDIQGFELEAGSTLSEKDGPDCTHQFSALYLWYSSHFQRDAVCLINFQDYVTGA